jgi:hypothetical protein
MTTPNAYFDQSHVAISMHSHGTISAGHPFQRSFPIGNPVRRLSTYNCAANIPSTPTMLCHPMSFTGLQRFIHQPVQSPYHIQHMMYPVYQRTSSAYYHAPMLSGRLVRTDQAMLTSDYRFESSADRRPSQLSLFNSMAQQLVY